MSEAIITTFNLRNRSSLWHRKLLAVGAVLFFVFASPLTGEGQARRIIMLKVDGLPYDLVERFARERDSQTGKSQLPWFEHIFFNNGTRVTNFYVRGMSLSAPSWSLLDTGQHLQIKGNVEFDRDTLHTYDYLNFIPLYFKQATRHNVDMPATEVIDSVGLHLLIDAYDNYERLPASQLYGRGIRLMTVERAGQAKFIKSPITLAEDFVGGLDLRNAVFDQYERELIQRLNDPRVRYLDLYDTSFDHLAHHNNDRESHLEVLRELDALLGRIWTAIEKSPMASDTVLVVVSDHGFNTDERVISQGFNLVKLLGSRAGGGHHVITKRRLLLSYSIKGINPFVPPITTTSSETYYLKDQSADFPTALLDFDGNERAGLHLRNSDINELQILLQELQRSDLSAPLRRTISDAFFDVLARDRNVWTAELAELETELGALHRAIEKQEALCEAQPTKFSVADREAGRDDNARRICLLKTQWAEMEEQYRTYIVPMRNLLSLRQETLSASKLKIEELIPRHAMGARNTVHNLENYVVGLSPKGLILKRDGSLDLEQTYLRINYFDLLKEQMVRNNVQSAVSSDPIDFIATRIPKETITSALPMDSQPDDDVIWLYGGMNRQALVLARGQSNGQLQLRYLPIGNLTQDDHGTFHFERAPWQPDFPLRMLEDVRLDIPNRDRIAWLNEWHTDIEWLHALHKTQYSNGLIGLHEQFTQFTAPAMDVDEPGLSDEERLLRSFHRRQRRLVETDMQISANNHWNFDVRGFNPGGNHGSYFRIATHSTLMFAGGERTGVPRGLAVTEPYDSLSVVPTILALTGSLQSDNHPVEALAKRGFVKFSGRVITEVVGSAFGTGAPGQAAH